jgi:hypothetical protein
MCKDPTICYMLDLLYTHTQLTQSDLVNYWDGDLFAIGFQKANRLIYISTYSYRDNSIPKFDFEVELIDAEGNTAGVIAQRTGALQGELINAIADLVV